MKLKNHSRPGLASRILKALISDPDSDGVKDCFDELYEEILEKRGASAARRWLMWQIVKSLPGFIFHRIYWNLILLKNYLVIAIRHLSKNKGIFAIKVFGLAAGIACSLVVILYVINETSYDTYQPGYQRIYRINSLIHNMVGEFNSATSPGPLGKRINEELSGIEAATRIIPPQENSGHVLVVKDRHRFFEKRVYFADPEVFDVFQLPLLEGDPTTALARPNTVVITRSISRRYFQEESALGQSLRFELDYDTGGAVTEDFTITGIISDPPPNTHLKMDFIVSMQTMIGQVTDLNQDWINPHSKYNYVRLSPGSKPEDLEQRLAPYSKEIKAMYSQRFNRVLERHDFRLQPIATIHMNTEWRRELEPPGNMYYVIIYSIVALLILMIGVLNFINLSSTLSVTRTREVGIRKSTGGRRIDLIIQFLSESLLITLMAFLLSLGFLALLLQFFNRMAGTELSVVQLLNPLVGLSLIILLLLVGLIAGSYPALILSACRPVDIINDNSAGVMKGSSIQRLLVIAQFAISIFLVICTFLVFQQLGFMKGRSLGFEREQKLILEVKSNQAHFRRDTEAIKQDFLKHPTILAASASSSVPGESFESGYYLQPASKTMGDWTGRLRVVTMDAGFLDHYGVKIIAGRGFQEDFGNDAANAYLVNESGARELGYNPEAALGNEYLASYHRKTKQIVGVTADFHLLGMKESTYPLIFDIEKSLYRVLTLTVNTNRIQDALVHIRQTWESHFPEAPFEYYFLDEAFDQVYRYEEEMGRLLGIITALGIGIAFLGLFGLVTFHTQIRRKEIGIRKVLGASPAAIILMLSRQFILLVILAGFMAVPAAWAAMNLWLQDFAYRIEPGPVVFIVAFGTAILIAICAVLFQGFRATGENTFQSLRSE